MPDEEILREGIVIEAPTRAQYSVPAAEQVLKQMEEIDPKYDGLPSLRQRLAEVKAGK